MRKESDSLPPGILGVNFRTEELSHVVICFLAFLQ